MLTQLTCTPFGGFEKPHACVCLRMKRNREHVNILLGMAFFFAWNQLIIYQHVRDNPETFWLVLLHRKGSDFYTRTYRTKVAKGKQLHSCASTKYFPLSSCVLRLHRPISCLDARPNLYAQWCLRTYKDVLHGAYPFAAIHSAQEWKKLDTR